jgi:hypothetical protein
MGAKAMAEFSPPFCEASIAVMGKEVGFCFLEADFALEPFAHVVAVIRNGRPQAVQLPEVEGLECAALVPVGLHDAPPIIVLLVDAISEPRMRKFGQFEWVFTHRLVRNETAMASSIAITKTDVHAGSSMLLISSRAAGRLKIRNTAADKKITPNRILIPPSVLLWVLLPCLMALGLVLFICIPPWIAGIRFFIGCDILITVFI